MNKKNRFSALAVICIFLISIITAVSSFASDDVDIRSTFPDPVLRDAIALKYDTNGDGKLSPEERSEDTLMVKGLINELEASRGLEADSLTVSSIEGIDCFENLKVLHCNSIGELDEFDISALTGLETLDCSGNSLTSLDLRSNSNLTWLHCCDNDLTSLDLTANTKLERVHCYANLELATLDVEGLTQLEELRCDGCKLETLDLSTNTALSVLNCSYNNLSSLDLSHTAVNSLTDYNLGNQHISSRLIYDEGLIKAPISLIEASVYSSSLDGDTAAYSNGAFCTDDYTKIQDGFTYLYTTGGNNCAEMKVFVSVSHTHDYAVSAYDFEAKTLTVSCQICGDSHTLSAAYTENYKEPTCTEAGGGTKTLTAVFEGETYTKQETEEEAALGHVEETIPAVAPTCTETGLTEGVKCSRCGNTITEQETVNTLGHAEETIPAVAPTCTGTGLTEGVKCSRCGDTITEQETVNALGHAEETIPAVAPTCTETGLTEGVKCSRCGDTITEQEIVNALGHAEETIPAVAPTCTETGLTEGVKCSRCGDTLTAQETVNALGHTNGEPVTENYTPSTCAEAGYYDSVVYCTVCETELSRNRVDLDILRHVTEAIPAVKPTCTQTGLTEGTRCKVCEKILTPQETVNALGHAEETIPAVAPTCTKAGLTEGVKCSRCGDILISQERVNALGHDYQPKPTEAKCTEKGYTTYTCSRCNDSYVTDYTEAKGHKWNGGVVTVQPTVEKEGTMLYTCTVCKVTKTEPIPKLTVEEVTPSEKEADKAPVNKKIKKPAGIRTISNKKKRQLTVYFNPVKNAQNYRVMFRKQGAENWTYSWTKGKTQYAIKNLKNNGLYEFCFAAYRKNAQGKWERGEYSKTSYRYYYKAVITKVKPLKGGLSVSWKQNKKSSGYLIEYADNFDMKKSKRITINTNSKTSYKIKGLKKGKKYYVRVRAVRKKAGKNYIGEFSQRKRVKIK